MLLSAADADICPEVPTYKHAVSHSDRGATARGPPQPGREGRHRLARGQPLPGDHYGDCSDGPCHSGSPSTLPGRLGREDEVVTAENRDDYTVIVPFRLWGPWTL